MLEQMRQTCRQMLEDGSVKVVIGYGRSLAGTPARPVFVTAPDQVEQLIWDDTCNFNLAKYLLRDEIRVLGKPAVIVKGCDERALVVLQVESQIDRSQIVVIGMACDGMGQRACETCDTHVPKSADVTIGQSAAGNAPGDRYAELELFMKKTPAERMAFWQAELSRCVKCYACRQACPLCYCRQCIVDKNRPTAIDTSATLKGNFAWHIARAFHLAGRCVGCDQCVRACPVGIDLRLLNLSLAKAAEDEFGYRSGVDPKQLPIVGNYSQQDHEDFIG